MPPNVRVAFTQGVLDLAKISSDFQYIWCRPKLETKTVQDFVVQLWRLCGVNEPFPPVKLSRQGHLIPLSLGIAILPDECMVTVHLEQATIAAGACSNGGPNRVQLVFPCPTAASLIPPVFNFCTLHGSAEHVAQLESISSASR